LVAWIRRKLRWLTLAYVAVLVVTLLALDWWGERNWLLSIFLYAPAQLLLAPLLVLSPLCAIFRPRMLLWHAAAAAVLLFGYMTFRWSTFPQPSASTVTAVTFNFGDSNRSQFHQFLEKERPDIIVLQDARGQGASLAQRIPGMQVSELGRMVLLSRFPIQKGALIEGAKVGDVPIAARWEVLIGERVVAIYSVHLPTPRRELSRFLGKRRFLDGLIGHGDRQVAFGEYREWINARIELARKLARVFAEEQRPMIVGGDFNTPDHGYIYHLFARQMTDAFAAAGRGWGLTFPGSTRNPVSFHGPWLRIDYFFAGRGWKVSECRPEPGFRSQHKAVLARFEPDLSL
jgi:endonuclease/exonuclease/phosphatase (EEP) superfamily protein YafD